MLQREAPSPLLRDPPASAQTVRGSARWIWTIALVPYVVAVAVSGRAIARGGSPGNLPDFLNAARAMRHGVDLYTSGTGGYVYPPLIAFLYQPASRLSDRSAAFVMLAVEAILAVVTLVLASRVMVRRLLGRTDERAAAWAAVIAAICTADKIKGEFAHLETNVLMLLAFTLGMRWVDRRPAACGAALGFAFNVKYLPLVLVPFLLVRRRWRAVGWFAVWAVAFAVLPAVSMGWRADAHAWGEATGGIGRLFGVAAAATAHVARVRRIVDPVSISATSGLARMTGLPPAAALGLATAVALVIAAAVAGAYLRAGLPLVAWPRGRGQGRRPFRGVFTVEWMAILLVMLALSPFTNSRHLYMLLDVNLAAAVLLVGGRGRRWPLAIAMVALWLGVTFPPGGARGFYRADAAWRFIGGPGWCMLGMAVALVHTNVRHQCAIPEDAGGADGEVELAGDAEPVTLASSSRW